MPQTVRALLLDAGNTIVFLDHAAVAEIAARAGVAVDPALLARVEGAAKRRYEALMASGMSHEEGWGLYLITLLQAAGVERTRAEALVPTLRAAHDALNLWRRVPEGLLEALRRIRAHGVRVGVVSNSEGRLPALFATVGLAEHIELVVDSHHEGVRKPDPELFRRALLRMRVPARDAIYLGDIPGVDVAGAQAAGIRAVLVDTLGFYPDHDASPKVSSVVEWIDAYLEDRSVGSS